MVFRNIIAVSFICLIIASTSLAADADKKRTSYFNDNWMKTVVSIEVILKSGDEKPIGTGFLVNSQNNHILLLTAKHVILDKEGNVIKNLAVRLNNRSGKSILLGDEIIKKLTGGKWFLSKTSDIACQFIYRKETSDVLFISISDFLSAAELNVGAPLVILGFPVGIRSDEFAVPIARKAMVARTDSDIIIVDGFVFPGNSGGPVVYSPTIKFGKGINSAVLNKQRLIGLVSQSINYVDIAVSQQTKRPRITFEDNTGLAKVIPTDAILELINREDVQEVDNKLK
jgi:V8-like Glu-specific endopeptidase